MGKMHVKIRINSQPSGALAVLPPGDRMHRIRTPFQWWLPPGEYVVEVSKEGFVSAKQTLRVEREGKDNFLVVLKESPTTGTVKLVGKAEGSDVRVNGKSRGPLPFEADLDPGEYSFKVFYAGGQSWEANAEIKPGEKLEMKVIVGQTIVRPQDPMVEESKPVWQWVTLASGLALGTVGGILAGVGVGNVDDANQLATEKRIMNDKDGYNDAIVDWEKGRNQAYAGYALLGVGGAAFVAGAVGLIYHFASSDDGGATAWTPIIGPDQAGFAFSLSF